MNLLLALFQIIGEAVPEGLRTGGHHLAAELTEAVYLAGIIPMVFAFANGYYNLNKNPVFYTFRDIASGLAKILIGYFLLRFAIFDIIWNISAGVEWYYYGVTKLYDKIMTVLGSWGWMVKAIAAVWGISWLLGWQDGIKRAR